MTPPIPTCEPADIVACDSVWWNLTDGRYPPSEGWVLSYAFVGPTSFQLGTDEITVDAETDSYQVRVPTSKTAVQPGTYRWYRIFANAGTGERHAEAAVGATVIRANPVTAGNVQTRAETMLAAYQAAHDAILSGQAKAYSVEGRAVTKQDLDFLARQIGIYSDKVRRERAAARNGGPVFGRTVAVRFRPAGFG